MVKRAAQAGVDVSNRSELLGFIRQHGREKTKFAVAEHQRSAAIQQKPREVLPIGNKPTETREQRLKRKGYRLDPQGNIIP